MKILGITGPTGAGKSLLCKHLTDLGVPCIDADEVYHSLLIPPSACLDEIRASFGSNVFDHQGTLDRDALGKIVFNDPEKLSTLNCAVLGHVLNEIRFIVSQYESKGFGMVAVDAPTLIESGFHKECSTVISVIASKEHRLDRITHRDHITNEKAALRVKAQKPDEFYISHSDLVITNDGDINKIMEAAKKIVAQTEEIPK